jgi:virginiamycin B lyase
MRSKTARLWMALALVCVAAIIGGLARLSAQGGVALSGVANSQEEGNMEGVLVTARRDGANFDVTVVSDAQGKYSFPRTHLQPGKYAVKIRAVGYDLATASTVDVATGATAGLDLKLQKTKDLSSQITSVEWLMSVKGTDEEKAMVVKQILSCTYCHSLERIVKSRHNAEQMVSVIHRMQKYYPDGSMAGTEGRGRAQFSTSTVDADGKMVNAAVEKNPSFGMAPGVLKKELAAYLATINRSEGKALPTDLKTLPRPTGKGTRVIITQYDMPRKDTVPHDMDVDSKGTPWYTDQSRPFLGKMDPKTGVFTEYAMPPVTKHEFSGGSDVQVDQDDNIWFPHTHDSVSNHFGLLHKFDPKTQTFTEADMPAQALTQFLDIGPDGKIWSGFGTFYRVDPKTMKPDFIFDWTKAPNVPPGPHSGYEVAIDPKGNPWITDFGGSYIVGVDVNTKATKFFKTPTAFSQPRRGKIDPQGRYWFGEYTGDKIGMFDTNTEKFIEYDPGIKWAAMYTASVPDKNGRVYSPSNTSDRLFRVDSKSGEIVTYLMPTRDFDTKQLKVDPVSRDVLWFANTRNARIVKVEPLD